MRPGIAIRAGVLYFVFVFLIGFALGTVRVLALEPALGPLNSVMIEIPVMLAASWAVAGRLIARLGVPRQLRARGSMGGVAISLLLIAETGLGVWGFGQTLVGHLAQYATPAGMAGQAGQMGFALIPALRLLRRD